MLLNAGHITSTPSTLQLLSRVKTLTADAINLLCSLGLVQSAPNAKTNGNDSSTTQKQQQSNKNENNKTNIDQGLGSRKKIASITAALIDTIRYEAKTGNLIFVLHNATSVLQAQPQFYELV